MKNKRLTIGLLVSGITEQFVIAVCKGVLHVAKRMDVDVVVLPGKYIDRDLSGNKEIMYEYQYNTLFSYAGRNTVDAVIVMADVIGCFTTKERIRQFLENYKDIPCVLVASKFPGYVSVTSDNYTGVHEAVDFLVHNKNCTRFAMIGGPKGNTDAEERRQAFIESLARYRIPFGKKQFVTGDLSKRDRAAAVTLLDKNPEVQAVFCVNDDVAITLYEEMKKRNLVPGKDIYVFGYDNSVQASKVNPTLSSVWTDTNRLGEEALSLLIRMMKGEKAESIVLPGRFVLRESVGRKRTQLDIPTLAYQEQIASYVDLVFYSCRSEFPENERKAELQLEQFLYHLFMLADVEDIYDHCALILEEADHIPLEYADIDNLLMVLEEVCSFICHHHKDLKLKYEVRRLFGILYCRLVRTVDAQLGFIQEKEEKNNYLFKLFVSNTMQFEKGNEKSYEKLISDIGFLGIKNAAVYMFEKPFIYLEQDEFVCPGQVSCKAVLGQGKLKPLSVTEKTTPMEEVFQFEAIAGGRFSAVTLPIFSNEILYGFFVCDLTPQLFDNAEFLVSQISSAAKMIDLLNANERIQQKLEESLSALKAHNIELDNLSKSDALTGIMNRRGFYTEAERLLEELKQRGNGALFAYIDMNNLKIINDRYGHEEGDFSLKLIGSSLSSIMNTITEHYGKKGIVGRIGGDEYACVIECTKEDWGSRFTDMTMELFDAFNRTSDKDYTVTVSVGTYQLPVGRSMELQEALSRADESLYEAKKHRVKSVAKMYKNALEKL